MLSASPESYIEARIAVSREMVDAVCNFIIDHITGGLVLEEEDESPETVITFYIPPGREQECREAFATYLADVYGGLGQPIPPVQEKVIKNRQWEEEYKASIKPVRIAGDILVRPSWSERPADVRFDILIEPKMAFGTGTHETTRTCLAVIRDRFRSGMRFLDLGTGSGILSILAAQMGATYIKAIDYDITAVQNAQENFEINGVTVPHEILFGSIEKAEQDQPYQFVCANIIKSTILPMLRRLLDRTEVGGILVLSGLLVQDEGDVSGALIEQSQTRFEIVHDNKWLTYIVYRQ